MIRSFLSDRLNVAWALSVIALAAVLVFVPNEGAGTLVLIFVAAVAIVLSGAARIRDGRRDRERKASQTGPR
jgi:uncharacterized membrane protein HdeD (DUF308 family)